MALVDNATAFWRLGDPLASNKLVDALGRGNDLTPYLRPAPVTLDFRMGSNNAPAQQLFGALAKWGKWDRLLTPSEKSALHAMQSWPFASTPSLKDAVAYFTLNEASGSPNYADATGRGNTLTASGTPTQTSGPMGTDNATLFDAGDSLWRSCTADLQTGNYPWTICGWVKLTAIPTGPLDQQIFWGQWDTSGTVSGTNLYFEPAGGTFSLDGGFPQQLAQGPAITNTTLNPTTGTWYFLLAEYDPAANKLIHTINNDVTKQRSLELIQQPMPAPGHIGYGSKFQLNEQFAFGVRSGWDAPPNVNGSCHAYMQRTSDVSFGNSSFTVWGWFNQENAAEAQTLLGLFDPNTSSVEWAVQIFGGNLYWVLGDGAGNYSVNSLALAVADGDFHLFVCWYDKATSTLQVSVDHAAQPLSTSLTITPGTMFGNSYFTVGSASRWNGFIGQQFKGVLNAIGIARGAPTQADLDMLWNSGNGIVLGNPRRPAASEFGPVH